jgi:glucokinase
MTLTIGVDIGGTKIAAGVVDGEGRILARCKEPTPGRTEDVAEAVGLAVDRLRQEHPVVAVGLGVGGFIDAERETVLFAKNIGWIGEPLRARMERRVGLPVVVENDANAAAWAEARFGAGRGESFLVGLTVGTGIGGGLVIDGRLHRGRFGTAAECGHLPLVPGGLACACGGDGCWEMYCSGTALAREARRLADEGNPLASGMLRRAGGRCGDITGDTVTAAAGDGDAGALELLRQAGWWLGRGMAALAAVLDPGCFVVGGGVAEAGDLLLDAARESFREHLPARGYRGEARIVLAGLGTEAGLIGAADLARQGG